MNSKSLKVHIGSLAWVSAFLMLGGCKLISPGVTEQGSLVSGTELARDAFDRGHYGIAISYLERELARKPESVLALNGLGASYDKLGRFNIARRYYFRALDIDPASSLTIGNIDYSYMLQGKSVEVANLYGLALEYDAGNLSVAAKLDALEGSSNREEEYLPKLEEAPVATMASEPAEAPSVLPVAEATPPARNSDVLLSAFLDGQLKLEVSNGNGINGIASRMRSYLQAQGGKVVRLTNADSFTYDETVIYYRAGYRQAAEQLAAALPSGQVALRESDALADWVDARLLIGLDLVAFDNAVTPGRTIAHLDR